MATLKKSSKKNTPTVKAKKSSVLPKKTGKTKSVSKKSAGKPKAATPKAKTAKSARGKASKKTGVKKPALKKPASRKTAAKKSGPKKTTVKKSTPAKKKAKKGKKIDAAPKKKAGAAPRKKTSATPKKASVKKSARKKKASKAARKPAVSTRKTQTISSMRDPALPMAKKKVPPRHPIGQKGKIIKPGKNPYTAAFLRKQKKLLLSLRDQLLDTMHGVARDGLGGHAESGDGSAFGLHQADAGSGSYDRDLSLNLLSQEQDALHEIDEAISRIDLGVYGICESCGRAIPKERLQFLPWARLTVECQELVEREFRGKASAPTGSLFRRGVKDGAGSGV